MDLDLTTWMTRERWDALVWGEGCPVCVELGQVASSQESRPGLDAGRAQGRGSVSLERLERNQRIEHVGRIGAVGIVEDRKSVP